MFHSSNPCPCSHPCSQVAANARLLSAGTPVRFHRGEVLWKEAEDARALVAVCTGALKLTREWPPGQEGILDLVARGQIVGEEAAIEGGRRPATCSVVAMGRGVRVERPALEKLLDAEPVLALGLLRRSCARLAAFTSRLGDRSGARVEGRLATVLVRLAHELGLDDGRGLFVPLRLTRSELAEMVGCRPETAIRVMTRWRREGLVETQREVLVILDPEKLDAVAGRAA
jgi:CRP-like cAMP-binding protein